MTIEKTQPRRPTAAANAGSSTCRRAYAGDVHVDRVRTVVRQDIQLQGSFAAQVNADLQIGAIEETTVTGASPTVDVINNQSTVVLDRDVLDAIPTTVRNLPMRAALIPGSSVTFITLGQYAT